MTNILLNSTLTFTVKGDKPKDTYTYTTTIGNYIDTVCTYLACKGVSDRLKGLSIAKQLSECVAIKDKVYNTNTTYPPIYPVYTRTPTVYARDILEDIYLDSFNKCLTIDTYADYNGLRVEDAETLLKLAKKVYESPHPCE